MKTLLNLKLQTPLLSLHGVLVQEQILDQPRSINDFHFCRSQPKIRHNPQLIGLSKNTINLLGINYQETKNNPQSSLYLSGSKLIMGSVPIAHNYSGYQFGSWAGQLGDGRAHILGSIRSHNCLLQLQLKGSGKTPFSRHADGNSVLSSALRQFLASELMAGLNVPTTRAASLVVADQPVMRDPLYNGTIKMEKAAILLRICQSFVCLSEGQMHKQTPLQNRKLLQPLCDYVISQHYKDINYQEQDPYEQLYKTLVNRSAELVAQWQTLGFCHGVLNTDNMSMGGVTIDYGPFAFIDYFSKDYISNGSDQYERYSFRRQPAIVEWNLQRLAQAMDPLFPYKIAIRYLKQNFRTIYEKKYYQIMCNKLGIAEKEESIQLIEQLIQNMHVCGTNYTNFFRLIQSQSLIKSQTAAFIDNIVAQSEPTQFYLNSLRAFPQLVGVESSKLREQDSAFNIEFVTEQSLRIKKKEELTVYNCRERNQRQRSIWAIWVQKYIKIRQENPSKLIRNPKYVLLNFIAKKITQEIQQLPNPQAVNLLQRILSVFEHPYELNEWFQQNYWKHSPIPIKLTCSS